LKRTEVPWIFTLYQPLDSKCFSIVPILPFHLLVGESSYHYLFIDGKHVSFVILLHGSISCLRVNSNYKISDAIIRNLHPSLFSTYIYRDLVSQKCRASLRHHVKFAKMHTIPRSRSLPTPRTLLPALLFNRTRDLISIFTHVGFRIPKRMESSKQDLFY
jgi:hypothetical protein